MEGEVLVRDLCKGEEGGGNTEARFKGEGMMNSAFDRGCLF